MSKMIYNVEDKPKFSHSLGGAFQHLLSIVTATILVPILIGLPDQISAALLGCGLGSITYILITKRKSPVIISSNFAFIGALVVAYVTNGYLGILLGGLFTGLVYVTLSIVIKFTGTKWISKWFPPIIIGPVVMLIGLTLASSAVNDLVSANGYYYVSYNQNILPYNLLALLCGLVTFTVTIIISVQNRNKRFRMIPFLFGILAGYLLALVFTIFGYVFDNSYLKIIDFSPIIKNFSNISITSFVDYPRFAFLKGIEEITTNSVKLSPLGVAEIALAFIPISLVSFSEHIADHKNLSSIIGRDLLEGEPGLSRTVMGDGVGSIVGTFFGICPNTTYGETVGCIALCKDASIKTILFACFMCIGLSFFSPLIAFFRTIPSCVIGGMCLVLYGFIAVSGLKMIQKEDLNKTKNLFTLSVILVAGIGGLTLQIPYRLGYIGGSDLVGPTGIITISSIAFSLILGMVTYTICSAIEKHNLPEEEN